VPFEACERLQVGNALQAGILLERRWEVFTEFRNAEHAWRMRRHEMPGGCREGTVADQPGRGGITSPQGVDQAGVIVTPVDSKAEGGVGSRRM
jgi:hypothetical protein